MPFSVRKQKPAHSVCLEEEILKSTEIKTEEDLRNFLTNVSKNGTNCKTTVNKTKGFKNRSSRNNEEL